MACVALTSAVLLAPLGIAKQFGFLLFLDAGMLENFMFLLPIGIAISWGMEAIFQIHHRGRQSFIQVFFVLLFWLLAPVYILFQCTLIATSLWKIATGRDGGWVVTARASTKASMATAKQQIPTSALKHEESRCSIAESDVEPDAEPDVVEP